MKGVPISAIRVLIAVVIFGFGYFISAQCF